MAKYAFGVDIGGTTVKMGLFNMEGELLDKWEIPTRPEDNGSNIIPDIGKAIHAKIAEKNISKDEIAGVGIDVPGAVNEEGIVFQAVNIGWGKFDLKAIAEKEFGLPVKAGNDATVATLGEAWRGGGKGYKNLLLVTLGTGVGGGIIAEGKLVNGATGSGGEIGHIHIEDEEEEACNCGNVGCFEQYASATGAVRLGKRILAATTEDSVLRGKEFSCKDIFDAAKNGDAVAKKITEKYGYYLGKGIAVCASILNPEVIVLGGGVIKCGDILLDLLRPSFEKYVFVGCKDAKITFATLGNDAGIYGSAKLVIED